MPLREYFSLIGWKRVKSDTEISSGFEILLASVSEDQMTSQLGKHLQDVGETYDEHFVHAGRYGLVLIGAGLACLVHAVFPFLFERTGSQCISKLYDHMAGRGRVAPKDGAPA